MSLRVELDNFYELFKKHLKGSQQATLRWVTCKDVNWDEGVMTAIDDDNLPYNNVMLGVSSILVKPKANTDCLIAIVEGHDGMAFLIAAHEVDQFSFNGGENGGLCNTPELKTQLEKLTGRVDGIIDAIKNSATGTQDGGATFKANMIIALESLTNKENFSNIEDTLIVH